MKGWLYLIVFIATFLILPILYAELLTPYGTASFWPLLLVSTAMIPLMARVASIGGVAK